MTLAAQLNEGAATASRTRIRFTLVNGAQIVVLLLEAAQLSALALSFANNVSAPVLADIASVLNISTFTFVDGGRVPVSIGPELGLYLGIGIQLLFVRTRTQSRCVSASCLALLLVFLLIDTFVLVRSVGVPESLTGLHGTV